MAGSKLSTTRCFPANRVESDVGCLGSVENLLLFSFVRDGGKSAIAAFMHGFEKFRDIHLVVLNFAELSARGQLGFIAGHSHIQVALQFDNVAQFEPLQNLL